MAAMQPILMMLVMFGIFYFILIRPQVKKQKEHQAMLTRLGKGDEVITRGGLIGKITGVSDDGIVVVELQEKVRELEKRIRDRSQKRLALSERALRALESFRDGAGQPIASARA